MPNEFSYLSIKLKEMREALAQVNALPQLSLLALIVGLFTGLIIVAFRLALEAPHLFLPMTSAESFESLPAELRVLLILSGTLVIALALKNLNIYQRQMSVAHVIDRLHNHQGYLPGKNTVAQFILAVAAIGSGHSVGREGPAVHLGAGSAAKLGRWLKLPNNSMQTIIACGVAAGISASFDTPLAGVIFAMEVIVMEYTIVGFVPVILSSVIAAAICKGILGSTIAFQVGGSSIHSLYELCFIVFTGLIIALLAGTFIKLNLLAQRFSKQPVMTRILAAGALTATVAIFVPEVMGLGYDTIQSTLDGSMLASALLVIALAKLLLSPIVVALGIPGGVIGPSLFVGACIGYVLGALAQWMFPSLHIDTSTYVLLGMTGMMAAIMNAPLAALIAILELSHNPSIIFPAMLMIVVACIGTRQLFNVRGIFIEQLASSGRDIEIGPATRALRRIGVLSIMNRNFLIADESVTCDTAKYIISTQPQWIIYSFDERLFALSTVDFAHFLENLPESLQAEGAMVHLSEVPGRRHMLHPISETDSLYDALKAMKKSSCDVLYVTSNVLSHRSIHGIVTLDAIQNHYQPKGFPHAMG